jgi:microcystin degradation protein MlrC
MRIFLATLGSEIDSFSPIPTSIETFEVCCLKRPLMDDDEDNWVAAPQLIFRKNARARDIEVIESLCAFAMPAGVPSGELYESLRDEILNDLINAGAVDAVIFHLHGALIADGYDDCEGDLLARTRAIVGPLTTIGGLFDLHAHITGEMISNATVLVGLKEYPHVDYAERSEELFNIVIDAVEGRVEPSMALFDCRMIGSISTTREPMRSFVDRMTALEQSTSAILSLTVNHGFRMGDVPSMGTSMLVVTDKDSAKAQILARKLGMELFAMRNDIVGNYLTIEQGLERALGKMGHGKPVVMADTDDNSGGGAPSDKTFVLRALLEKGIRNAGLAFLWDPVAVRIAQGVGVGGRIKMRIGGHTPISGDPIDVDATVIALCPDFHQRGYGAEVKIYVGNCAAINVNGINIVLSSEREQPLSLDAFTGFGLDPKILDLIVVKSTQHFHADFAPIAADVIYVNPHARGTPGSEILQHDYKRINRPKWPFDTDPFDSSPG